MINHISLYKKRLNLQDAIFSLIDHDDAMVGVVYKITRASDKPLILKIYSRPNDYLREIFFLKYFADILPVPHIIQIVPPEAEIEGAILMECLTGTLLSDADFKDSLANEIGSLLARIHLNRVAGYGDLTEPNDINLDPCTHFRLKFEEGLDECKDHLPKAMLTEFRRYYNDHLNLFEAVDGPCIIHRDFRPGNLIVDNEILQGIIDWSSARAGFAEEDFCSLEHEKWTGYSSSKQAFLKGYASIRPVPDYRAIMPLLRLSKAIATIGFTVKRETWNNCHKRVYLFNRQYLDTFL